MAPTLSTDAVLTPAEGRALLDVARRAIETGLEGHRLRPSAADFPAALRAVRATFVTLELGGDLRGCIGTLEARRALVEDVAWHAHAAAFEDPRFPPVTRVDLDRLDVHLSLLSAPEAIASAPEADVIRGLRPFVDGLVLQEGTRRATFLPAVWEQLPDPAEFLRHLKRKAGLPPGYWSATLQVSRYIVETVP